MQKGISLFPGMGYLLSASIEYLRLARAAGFSRLFTSLHIPEADSGNLLEEFRQIAAAAKALGFMITADVSPRTFQLLGASLDNLDPVRALQLDALRIDFGFTPAEIAYWTRETGFIIELNASTIDSRTLNEIIAAGAKTSRIQACHNYYPRPETGIAWEIFVDRSRMFRQHGISVAAFIPSLTNPRGPLGAGLPTLEQHRYLNPVIAAKQLAYSGLVDAVIFGDPLADSEEINGVGAIQSDCMDLHIHTVANLSQVERSILFVAHKNRPDPAEWVVRSETSRSIKTEAIHPRQPIPRRRGSVTIDNEKYLRYMGELQIVKKDLPADERVNVVAEVVEEEKFLIDMIRPGMKFRFIQQQ